MSLATTIGESQPEKEERASRAKTCSVGIQYCCQHMDAEASSDLMLVKASDEPNAQPERLSNGSCADEEKQTNESSSTEQPMKQNENETAREQLEAELDVTTESEPPVEGSDAKAMEEANADTQESLEQQCHSEHVLLHDEDDAENHPEESKVETDITAVEISEKAATDLIIDATMEPTEATKEDGEDENNQQEENQGDVHPSQADAAGIDDTDGTEETAPEAEVSQPPELLSEDNDKKQESDKTEEAVTEKDSTPMEQADPMEIQESKESTDAYEAQEPRVDSETLEIGAAEPAEQKSKPTSDGAKKKKTETKFSKATSKPTAITPKVKNPSSRPTAKTDADGPKEEAAAVQKPKKPAMSMRPTAIPGPSKAEHDEASGNSEQKASATLRRVSAGRAVAIKQQKQPSEEAKDSKSTTSPPKAKPTTVHRPSTAASTSTGIKSEAKDGEEKETPTSKPKRRSLTTEKPAATAATGSTRDKQRAVSAAESTSKSKRTSTLMTRRATVGDSPTASAATETPAEVASTVGQGASMQAAKADELRRSNSSQLSKNESGGSSEVFPDGSAASGGGPSRLRAPAVTRVHRVTQRTPDCTELQHVTKPTPMPEIRGPVEIKQTAASRGRLQKLQEEANKALEASNENQYLTPLQRKESEVKELRRLLQEAYQVITEREEEIEAAARAKAEDINAAVKDKEEFIAELQAAIDQLTLDYQALTALHGEVKRREEELEREVARLRQEMEEREQRHQQYYLEMYRKGQESAKFERQDELEKLAVQEPDKVSIDELVEKLELTQQDLHKWQSLKLMETYSESEQPATEADARLRFLRDSMFHYLTEKDRDQGLQHLTAIIGIFNFTEVQMATIMKCLADRKKKGKI